MRSSALIVTPLFDDGIDITSDHLEYEFTVTRTTMSLIRLEKNQRALYSVVPSLDTKAFVFHLEASGKILTFEMAFDKQPYAFIYSRPVCESSDQGFHSIYLLMNRKHF